jgi:hypothetical protein
VAGCVFEWVNPNDLEIRLPNSDTKKFADEHPLVSVTSRVLSTWNAPFVHPGIWRLFPEVAVERLRVERARAAAHECLRRELDKLCTGWVKFYYHTGGRTFGLQPLAAEGEWGDRQLFGFTWIFPWAPFVLRTTPPNCIESDGTFASLHPYTLEIIEAIICNESLPIGLGVTPTETAASYQRLWDHLREILGDQADIFLNAIPFLSDEGQGLMSFARAAGLIWLNCHRHLIEKAGAAFLAGDWVRRLLKCGNLDEAKLVAAAILGEIQTLERAGTNVFTKACVRTLVMGMIVAVLDEAEDSLRLWARWLRLLCPTTTNAAEAIHAVLNKHTRDVRCLIRRLEEVKACLWRRFEARNSPDRLRDRNTHREEKKDPERHSPGNRTFYQALFTSRRDAANGQFRPVTGSWLFPEAQPGDIPTEFPEPEWLPIGELLPPTWREPPSAESEAQYLGLIAPGADAGAPGQGLPIPAAPARTAAYLTAGRGIIKSILNIRRHNPQWLKKSNRDAIAAAVWGYGGHMQLMAHVVIRSQDEVTWRMAVYQQYGLVR